MHHHARIRALRSDQKQNSCQEKYEHANTSTNFKNIIYDVNDKTKRNFKRNDRLSNQNKLTKNSIRELRINKVKEEIREEPKFQMKT